MLTIFSLFLFLCATFFILMFAMILVDLLTYCFGTKIVGNVVNVTIHSFNLKKNHLIYVLKVSYEFRYKGINYKSTRLNSLYDFSSSNKLKIETIANKLKKQKELNIYLIPFSKLSMIFPLKYNYTALIKLSTLMLSCVIFGTTLWYFFSINPLK